MLDKFKTWTGIPASKIPDELAKYFDDARAYKSISGGTAGAANLTDIDTAFMFERLNEVFGPCGLGWGLEFDRESVVTEAAGKQVSVALMRAEFWYELLGEEAARRVHILTTGGSKNTELAYALKGTLTSAIGNAVSKLRFQEDVYKGILDHNNASQKLRAMRAANGKKPGNPGSAPPERSTAKRSSEPGASPAEFVVTFGQHAGSKLGELPTDYIRWLAEKMKPANGQGKALQAAAREYLTGLPEAA
jgi:uncharacterized protein (DUF3820 family)